MLRDDGDGRLWQHIAQLSERCRALLRVIAFADRPDYAAVAEALGMPVGSIGPTRGRCLAKLRQQLANDPAWEDDDHPRRRPRTSSPPSAIDDATICALLGQLGRALRRASTRCRPGWSSASSSASPSTRCTPRSPSCSARGDLAGVRSDGAGEAQTVTFTSASLTTMITITPTVGRPGPHRRLDRARRPE